jgi:hypothetical protein
MVALAIAATDAMPVMGVMGVMCVMCEAMIAKVRGPVVRAWVTPPSARNARRWSRLNWP